MDRLRTPEMDWLEFKSGALFALDIRKENFLSENCLPGGKRYSSEQLASRRKSWIEDVYTKLNNIINSGHSYDEVVEKMEQLREEIRNDPDRSGDFVRIPLINTLENYLRGAYPYNGLS